MPWLIDELQGRGAAPVDTSYLEPANVSDRLSSPLFVPDPSVWPIKLVQNSAHKSRPDYFAGPMTGTIIVSRHFRDLLEAFEKDVHVFIPAVFRLPDGTELSDEYFVFKCGQNVKGGLSEENSEIRRRVIGGKDRGYGVLSMTPRLTWNQKAIEGLHLWTDIDLPRAITVSDAFYDRLKNSAKTAFLAMESRTL